MLFARTVVLPLTLQLMPHPQDDDGTDMNGIANDISAEHRIADRATNLLRYCRTVLEHHQALRDTLRAHGIIEARGCWEFRGQMSICLNIHLTPFINLMSTLLNLLQRPRHGSPHI